MDQYVDNVVGERPPRLLTDDERLLLHAWATANGVLSAFVSQRQTDDPAIYRRIVVFRRVTKRHLYLIHCPLGSSGWIVLSAVERDDLGYFPSLRDALNFIRPVTLPRQTVELRKFA
jgi:hypothetical protein